MVNENFTQARAVFHLFQDIGKVMRVFESEATLCEGVTFIQFCILDHILSRGGRLGMSDLHELLSVEKSTTTRMVEPLVKRELVTKEKSNHDARAVELVITDAGRSVHATVEGCVLGFIEDILKQIPSEKKDDVLKAIGVFVTSVRQCCGGSGCF